MLRITIAFAFFTLLCWEIASQTQTNEANGPWEIVANPDLKGSTGRIVVVVPGEASMIFHVLQAGTNKQLEAWYESKSGNFVPGQYDIRIWKKVIPGAPVEKGKDTRIRVGILQIATDGPYKIYDDSKSLVFSGHGKEKPRIVLPVGNYFVEIRKTQDPFTIKNGEVTNY